MALVVNHNAMSATAARNLNSAYNNLSKSVNRLSSGLRINSAADDAAGLAIREMMRADVTALHQGVRNANDAISLIQTADGALGVIDEKLTRMKELAEQAATGSYTSTQRLIIDSEYQAMASEITRIANATDFNGMKLLDGSLSGATHDGSKADTEGMMKVHFGTGNDSAEDYYYIRIQEVTAAALGVGSSSDYNTTIDRVKTAFANAIKGEFGSMATGTAEEREAYQQLIDTVDSILGKGTEAANKIFDDSKTLEEQYAAYSSLFKRPGQGSGTEVDQDAGEGMRIYSSVEDLQKAAYEYYRNEAANGLGGANGFAGGADANTKALNNVAKMFDNAVIVGEGGNMLPELSFEEFSKLSSADRDALKTDFAMAMLNTTVNGTAAQQSSTSVKATGTNYSNYDSMAGATVGTATTNNAYTEKEINSFISNLDYGYEAAKTRTQAINGLTDQAMGKYGEGTRGVLEFSEGTILKTTGILKEDTTLVAATTTTANDPHTLVEGSTVADGSVLSSGTILGTGTTIGEGTKLGSNLTITAAAGITLGKGTSVGGGTKLATALALSAGTTLTTGTKLDANSTLGAGTKLGDGSTITATATLGAGSTLGGGTVLGNGTTLEAGTVFGKGTTLNTANIGQLSIGTTIGVGSQLGGAFVLDATDGPVKITYGGDTYEVTGDGAKTLATLFNEAVVAAGKPNPGIANTEMFTLADSLTLGADNTLAGNVVSDGNVILAAQETLATDLTLAGKTTLGNNGGTGATLAGDSSFMGTTLGGTTTLTAGGSALTDGTVLGDTADNSIIGTLGGGSTMGDDTTFVENDILGAGTSFGTGTTFNYDVTLAGDTVMGGKTILAGANTSLGAGSKLSAGSELASGSIVPKDATALNSSLLTGTSGIAELNGAYGELGFNKTTNTIERTQDVKFGSFQAAAEELLVRVGTNAANTINMDGNNVKTQENAQKALKAIDNAILIKDNIRADLGALQNRLENTITNLTTQAENLQAAESRISDVDVATEMTEFTRNQVLTQSAVSMLAQANTMPQMALKLIG